MDITELLMQVATALIGVLVPLVAGVVGYYAQKALKALEVKKYAEALREYDAALYERLVEAGHVALAMARDRTILFGEENIQPYLYRQAAEVSRAFSEKTGVRVDLNEERINVLIKLAMIEAKNALRDQDGRPLPPPPPPPASGQPSTNPQPPRS